MRRILDPGSKREIGFFSRDVANDVSASLREARGEKETTLKIGLTFRERKGHKIVNLHKTTRTLKTDRRNFWKDYRQALRDWIDELTAEYGDEGYGEGLFVDFITIV